MHTQLGWQKRQQTVLDISLVMATTALLVSTAAVAAAAGGVLPFAITQEELASLGQEQEETLADSIVSNVLDDQNVEVGEQDNTAKQGAANVGVQDQDLTQDLTQDQTAENFNFDFDFQYGFQVDTP